MRPLMVAFGLALCFVGILVALFASLVALAAFSDAWYRCPGNQCHDAIGSGVIGVMLAAGGLLTLLIGAHRLRCLAK